MKPSLFERLLMAVLPYAEIKKTIDGQEVVYLRRFFLKRWGTGRVYLHHILRSDDDPDPHDHPWDFTSVVLSGGYTDEQWEFRQPSQVVYETSPYFHLGERRFMGNEVVRPLSVVRRLATHIHRVVLTNGPAWTLVFTSGKKRSWGFVRSYRWEYWRSYLNVWGPCETGD